VGLKRGEKAQLGKNDELPVRCNTVLFVAERPGQINPRQARIPAFPHDFLSGRLQPVPPTRQCSTIEHVSCANDTLYVL